MNHTAVFLFVLASHTSISAFVVSVLLVFGAVFLTLFYVGWRKFHSIEDEVTQKNDEEKSQ